MYIYFLHWTEWKLWCVVFSFPLVTLFYVISIQRNRTWMYIDHIPLIYLNEKYTDQPIVGCEVKRMCRRGKKNTEENVNVTNNLKRRNLFKLLPSTDFPIEIWPKHTRADISQSHWAWTWVSVWRSFDWAFHWSGPVGAWHLKYSNGCGYGYISVTKKIK